jgi:hypothetical protein
MQSWDNMQRAENMQSWDDTQRDMKRGELECNSVTAALKCDECTWKLLFRFIG